MPIIKLYHHGTTAGTPPGVNTHPRAKRDVVQGWTAKTARANTAFLRSIHLPSLTGEGIAFTLTLRDCPATHEHWKRLREAFLEFLRRNGRLRVHWVTEWQRRGVPHLHGVVYFNTLTSRQYVTIHRGILETWCRVAGPYGAAKHAQHIAPIEDALGWLQYLAKHASRGASHYQRSADNIPPGWKGRTGRIWGHVGEWPAHEPMKFEVDQEGFFKWRRIVRAWRLAQARADGHPRRIHQARRMFNCPDKPLSELRGVSEWIPEDLNLQFLAAVALAGGNVNQIG